MPADLAVTNVVGSSRAACIYIYIYRRCYYCSACWGQAGSQVLLDLYGIFIGVETKRVHIYYH